MISDVNSHLFSQFTIEQWIEWIKRAINYQPCQPAIPSGDREVHHSLAEVYNDLAPGEISDRFAEAVTSVFETTPLIHKYAGNLYHLLQLIGYIKPVRAKRLLRKPLFAEVLKSLNYGNQNLHALLLVTLSKYDVDDELAYYVKRSAEKSVEHSYRLVCLRIIASRSKEELAALLELAHNSADTNIKAYQLARELRGLFRKYGFKFYCEWLTPDSENSSFISPEIQTALNEIVFSRFELPLFEGKQSLSTLTLNRDPYETLLGSQLLAGRTGTLNPKQIVAVALTHRRVEDTELVVRGLISIWRRIAAKDSARQPWFFFSGSPYINRKRAIVSLGAVPNASPSFPFESDEDPVLTAILEKIKNACEVHIPLTFTARSA